MTKISDAITVRSADGQSGAVLVTIMVVMMLAMLFASTLVNHFAVQEALAIEQHLANIRANWVMRGHVNYVLSRAWSNHNALCGGTGCDIVADIPDDDDAPRRDALIVLFQELQTQGGTIRRWLYDGGYFVDVQAIVTDPDVATVNGRMRFQIKLVPIGATANVFGSSSALPTLAAFDNHSGVAVPDLWVDICLFDSPIACPATLPDNSEFGKSLITQVLRSPPS